MARIPTAANLGAAQLRGAGGAAQLNLGVAKETGAAGNALGNAIASAGSAIGSAVSALASAAKASNDAFALPEAQLELETRLSEYDRNAYGNAGEDGAGLTAYPDGAKGIAEDVFKQFAPRMSEDDQRRFKIKSGFNILRRSERAIEEGQKLAIGYADKKEGQLYTGWTTRLGESGGWANDEAVNQAWGAIRDSVRARVGHTYTPDQAAQREKQLLGQFTAERLSWLADNDPEAFKALEGKASKGIVDENAEAPRPVPNVGPQSRAQPSSFGNVRIGDVKSDGMAIVTAGSGARVRVSGRYADRFAGLLADLESRGVKIDPKQTGGYANRNIANTNTKSRHAFGEAIDINWNENSRGRHGAIRNVLNKAEINALARKWGLKWGGNWKNPDDMHFEVDRSARPRTQFASGGIQNSAGGVQLSAYSPQRGGSRMEGGYASARPGPDGQRVVRTLEDFASGRAQYVTVAGNPNEYGKQFVIPEISYVDASGQTKTLKNVKAVVHDTGSAFKNAPVGRYDVPIDRDASDAQMQASHAIWKKQGVQFVEQSGSSAPDRAPNPGRLITAGQLPPEGSEAYRQLSERFGGDVAAMKEAVGIAPDGQQQGVQVADLTGGAAGGVPGTSVAATGDPSPEELANRAGLKFGFDQETGQAKLALGKETADRLAQIVQENPDAKVAEYLNDEQKAALSSAGLDVEGMTVSQAAALATAAAQEQGVQIAQKSSGPVVPEGDPFLSGRLLKGQTFSVKAAGGKTLTFSSEMLNAVSPQIMKQIRKAAGERQRALIKEQRYMADDMMARQVLTVEKTGHGAEKFDMGLVRQVYKGTKALAKFQRQVEVAKRSFDAKKGMADLPDEELQARLNELEADVLDEQGDADPVVEKTFERTQKAMGNLMKLRQTDPALAVQESKEVKSFVEGFLKGKPPKTPAEMYGLIDARIQAQIKLGLHPTPITKREAQKMLEPLVRAGSLTEKREQARKLSQSLREVYREHAETVMNAALFLNKRDTEDDRLTLNSTFRALMRDAAKPPASTYKGLGSNRSDRLDGGNPFDRYDVAP